jgi:hypothetical protein
LCAGVETSTFGGVCFCVCLSAGVFVCLHVKYLWLVCGRVQKCAHTCMYCVSALCCVVGCGLWVVGCGLWVVGCVVCCVVCCVCVCVLLMNIHKISLSLSLSLSLV